MIWLSLSLSLSLSLTHTHTHTHTHWSQGVDASQGGIQLVSNVIYKMLNIDVSVLMGANIAAEVARGDFCESTLGK